MNKKILLVLISVCLMTSMLFSASKVDEEKSSKRFIRDVERITGELDNDGKAIARYSFSCTYANLGYSWVGDLEIDKAAKSMSISDYNKAVDNAANMTSKPSARTAIKAGKAGEKVLKALANSTEKALKAGKKWLDESSEEFDENHKD